MSAPGPQAKYPAYYVKRKTIGWFCIGTANVLEGMIEGKDHYEGAAVLTAKELKVWDGIGSDLSNAERRLRALGKHLLKGEYGGH